MQPGRARNIQEYLGISRDIPRAACLGVQGVYEIWRSTSTGGNNRNNAVLIGTSASITYSDVTAAGAYYYWVRAKNIQAAQIGSTTKSYFSGFLPSSATGGVQGVAADVGGPKLL